MDTISNNIANVNTTRTAAGGPYRRQMVVFEPREEEQQLSFTAMVETAMKKRATGEGVRVVGIKQSDEPPKMVFDPSHPDANAQGYVLMPNVNIITEMVDLITASRAYEANVTAINTAKAMAMKILELGR